MKLLLVLLSGCALLSKSKPVAVHYYVPPIADDAGVTKSASQPTPIRIARIAASSHLGYAIAYRTSPVELQLYDLDRWTETPDVYTRRSLERALFRDHALVEASTEEALSIDVDVLAFEELRSPPSGRVQLRYTIHQNDRVIATSTVTSVRDAHSASREDTVVAIGHALDAAADEVADRVADAVAHPVQPGGADEPPGHRVSRRR